MVFGVMAMLHVTNGLYLVGPWYLDEWNETGKAPLYNLFNSNDAVVSYGAFLVLNGLLLFYASAGRSDRRFYTPILSGTLLTGFLVRLYSLIGTLMILESWRPPSYLSHAATVLMLGAYWVLIRVDSNNVRTVQ